MKHMFDDLKCPSGLTEGDHVLMRRRDILYVMPWETAEAGTLACLMEETVVRLPKSMYVTPDDQEEAHA
jgi:hypothetical protein